jgi:hypothetical protein
VPISSVPATTRVVNPPPPAAFPSTTYGAPVGRASVDSSVPWITPDPDHHGRDHGYSEPMEGGR